MEKRFAALAKTETAEYEPRLAAATVVGIHEVFARYPEVERVVLYGSRAKGNFKPARHDLTLSGNGLDERILGRIDDALDDLLLPYQFDLSIMAKITHADLLEHIQRWA